MEGSTELFLKALLLTATNTFSHQTLAYIVRHRLINNKLYKTVFLAEISVLDLYTLCAPDTVCNRKRNVQNDVIQRIQQKYE